MIIERADRMKGVEMSRIRATLTKCNEMKRAGIDLAMFTVGQPDFDTPQYIKDACEASIEAGHTAYAETPGSLELRTAIAKKLKTQNHVEYDPAEISVTTGAAQAAFLGMMTWLNPGDEIIIPNPSYNIYSTIPLIAGATVKTYELLEENRFQIDLEQMKNLITDKTKMIVLLSPNNPIGSILERENLEGLADLIRDKNIVVLSDEVYERLTYGEEAVSFASLPGMKERSILMGGFSKAFSMTGWRVGYFAAPKEMTEVMNILSFYMTACGVTFTQEAARVALEEEDGSLEQMRKEFEKRRDYIVAEINKTKHFHALMPKGAFYVFMNIKASGMTSGEFCDKMLDDYRCSFIPGDVFGSAGEGFVRLSYASSMENLQRLVVALNDLDAKLG